MSITELTILNFKAPYTINSSPLPQLFGDLGEQQSKWSSYPLLTFIDAGDNSTGYLISGWSSVEAHREWINSDDNKQTATTFSPYLADFIGRNLDFPFQQDKVDVEHIVYQNIPEGAQVQDDEERTTHWTAIGRDLDHPESGWHKLSSYSHATENPQRSSTGCRVLERVRNE